MSTRIAACDLGKASVSFVVARLEDDGALAIDDTQYRLHEGDPLELFREW